MSTQMAHAMKVAMDKSKGSTGHALRIKPLIERTWLWLRDHPEKTTAEMAAAIGEKLSAVSSVISTMALRGMVVRTTKQDLRNRRTAYRYKVSIKEYELLPPPLVQKPPTPATASSPTTATALVPTTAAMHEDKLQVMIAALEQCTLSECRALYVHLEKIFGR